MKLNALLLIFLLTVEAHLRVVNCWALEISVVASRGGKDLSFTLIPDEQAANCDLTLHASRSAALLSQAAANGDTVAALQNIGSPTELIARNMSILRLTRGSMRIKRSVIHFAANANCGGVSTLSQQASLNVRTSQNRGKPFRRWAAELAQKLVRGDLAISDAFPNLSFEQPVDLQNAGDGTGRLFVVEQGGKIYAVDGTPTVATKQLFLDITSRVSSGGERGLLGLAFPADYKDKGLFFVNYTIKGTGDTVIARYKVSENTPSQADENSELVILSVEQPFSNHNGGQLAFGPDGYLYIGLGDGGSGGDPFGHGQDLSTLLGSFLRIDVHHDAGVRNYSIPADNPFAENNAGFREEIFAYGFRNPWRFSFDPVTQVLWTADVGQGSFEEVDIVEAGKNYGWNIMEGNSCFKPATGCSREGLEFPIIDYGRDLGQSVTGGHVYRGNEHPSLRGLYIFGDFASSKIFVLDPRTRNFFTLLDTGLAISSFGVDKNRELYVVSYGDGKIYRF